METKKEQIKTGIAATLSFAEWISPHVSSCLVYDRIRTDDFKQPDPGWDVRLNVGLKLYEVNVKSSGPVSNTPDLQTALNSRNLATKPSEIVNGFIVRRGEEKEINVQAYFLPEDAKNFVYLIAWARLSDLMDEGPPAHYVRGIRQYSEKNPRLRYDTLLGTLRPMKELIQYLKPIQ
ncbi:MAG: hypothetical protein JRN52_07845 [Nitrososphaerota archaeon]|nr:hypothetical protein [Nitrososphaerota archaeon]